MYKPKKIGRFGTLGRKGFLLPLALVHLKFFNFIHYMFIGLVIGKLPKKIFKKVFVFLLVLSFVGRVTRKKILSTYEHSRQVTISHKSKV